MWKSQPLGSIEYSWHLAKCFLNAEEVGKMKLLAMVVRLCFLVSAILVIFFECLSG